MSNICVIKYHTSWPDPSDPFYLYTKSVEGSKGIDPRILGYYIPGTSGGVPYTRFGGFHGGYTTAFSVSDEMKDVADSVNTLMSPYKMSVVQNITADSIIATVTVTATDDVPALTDLRLAVVFAEQYNPFHGTNGRPYYTNIVRRIVPGIVASGTGAGSIKVTAQYPAFALAKGATQTYRYSAPLDESWNLAQMMSVAFIQSAGTQEVFQSAWTVPTVTVTGTDGQFTVVPLNTPEAWTLKNNDSKAVTVKMSAVASGAPSKWTMTFTGNGVTNNQVTLNPGESKDVTLSVSGGGAAGKMVGYAGSTAYFTTSDGVGITGRQSAFLGADTKDLLVDVSGNLGQASDVQLKMETQGYQAATMTNDAPLYDMNSLSQNLSQFEHIIYNFGPNFGGLNYKTNMPTLQSYVAGGGKMLISASNIADGYFQAASRYSDDTWITDWEDNFELEVKAAGTTKWTAIKGVDGDPISNGISTTLSGNLAKYAKIGVGGPDAHGIFLSNRGDTIGVRADIGLGKFVYLGFSPDTVALADRAIVYSRIFSYLDGLTSDVKPPVSNSAVVVDNVYPNPVNAQTTIGYSIPDHRFVSLVVRDMMGREITTLVSRSLEAGHYTFPFDASNLANGTYIYSLTAGDYKAEGKITVAH